MKNTMPAMKLMPPNTAIRIRKPARPSERCGVITAEKIVGSSSALWADVLSAAMIVKYTAKMAKKALPKTTKKPSVKKALTKARKGKAAKGKAQPERAKADAKAVVGVIPPMSAAQIEEAFRRFQAAEPEPKTELKYVNPFTLLVAVVMSAQATDAGVNKATPALFALADTPEKMAALGEGRVRDLIKTIGLFRNKAKNVVALSHKLIAEYGGQVPRTREALESLPGVGRKTANVVLGNAFGINVGIVVDTHVARLSARFGLTRETDPVKIEQTLIPLFPQAGWTMLSHLMIWHGRRTCDARKPKCAECVLRDICPSAA